jgi:hypothetical protein
MSKAQRLEDMLVEIIIESLARNTFNDKADPVNVHLSYAKQG